MTSLEWQAPNVGEFTLGEALAAGLISDAEALEMGYVGTRVGDNGGPPLEAERNPLGGLNPKQIFIMCVRVSSERAHMRSVLWSVSRFFDKDARNSSISYLQIARESGCSEVTAKRKVKGAEGRWLLIERRKGYVRPQGPENLYHGICPPELVDRLRRAKLKGKTGVSGRHPCYARNGPGPASNMGYQTDTPDRGAGYQAETPGVSAGDRDCGFTQERVSPLTPRKRGARDRREGKNLLLIIDTLKLAGFSKAILELFVTPVVNSLTVRHDNPRGLFEETIKEFERLGYHRSEQVLRNAAQHMVTTRKVWSAVKDAHEAIKAALPLSKQFKIRPEMTNHWAAWKAHYQAAGKSSYARFCEGQGYFWELTEWPPGHSPEENRTDQA
jgi:hypothetical protein